ncbi:2071_t:CDS:2, partial [Funneliformis caledonium]
MIFCFHYSKKKRKAGSIDKLWSPIEEMYTVANIQSAKKQKTDENTEEIDPTEEIDSTEESDD